MNIISKSFALLLAVVVTAASAFTTTTSDVSGRHHQSTALGTPLNMESASSAFLSTLSSSSKLPKKDVPGESTKFLSTLTTTRQQKKKKNSLNVGAFLDALGTMYQEFQQDVVPQQKVQDDIKKKTNKAAAAATTTSSTTATATTMGTTTIRLPKSVRKHIRTLKTKHLIDEANRYFQAEMIKAQEKKTRM